MSAIAAQKAREAAQEIVNEWVDSGQYATSKSERRAYEKDAIESIAALILRVIEESRQPSESMPLAPNFAAQQFVRNYRINRGWVDQEWSVPQTAEIAQAYREAAASLKEIRAEVEESRGQPEPRLGTCEFSPIHQSTPHYFEDQTCVNWAAERRQEPPK